MAFPPHMEVAAAWLAFIPLLAVAYHSSPRNSFNWGWLSGFSFWLLSMAWLLKLGDTGGPWLLVITGWLLLAAYCALFTGWFLLLASFVFQWLRDGRKGRERDSDAGISIPRRLAALVTIPAVWVGLEYWRSTVLTGFPWNGLGVSQFLNIPVIQIAEWTGVYGVSAIIMMVNLGLAFAGMRILHAIRRQRVSRFNIEMLVSLAAVVACCLYGLDRVKSMAWNDDDWVVVGAVQPNIPQDKKWPDEYALMVSESLEEKTLQLQAYAPDLIVWPETSVPGVLPYDTGAMAFVRNLAARGSPILVGGIEPSNQSAIRMHSRERLPLAGEKTGMPRYFNSAMLFVPTGKVQGLYRKQHLVPFGEYLPMDNWFPIIEQLAPLGFLCDSGSTTTVFRVEAGSRPGPDDGSASRARVLQFSALICFEDVFGYIARHAVQKGARMLVNQTNDAWFDGTSGAIQHMSHSVFRCVENRVPMARSANTGVSCLIDQAGRLDKETLARVRAGGSMAIPYCVGEICVEGEEKAPTFYTRYGDVPFALPCGVFSVGLLGLAWWRSRKMRLETSSGEDNSQPVLMAGLRSGISKDSGDTPK